MKVTYCDICFQVIKPGSKKYVMGVHTMTQAKNENYQDDDELKDAFLRKIKSPYASIELYEICPECRKVLEHFFHIRKEKLVKIQEELKSICKKKIGDKKNG